MRKCRQDAIDRSRHRIGVGEDLVVELRVGLLNRLLLAVGLVAVQGAPQAMPTNGPEVEIEQVQFVRARQANEAWNAGSAKFDQSCPDGAHNIKVLLPPVAAELHAVADQQPEEEPKSPKESAVQRDQLSDFVHAWPISWVLLCFAAGFVIGFGRPAR